MNKLYNEINEYFNERTINNFEYLQDNIYTSVMKEYNAKRPNIWICSLKKIDFLNGCFVLMSDYTIVYKNKIYIIDTIEENFIILINYWKLSNDNKVKEIYIFNTKNISKEDITKLQLELTI